LCIGWRVGLDSGLSPLVCAVDQFVHEQPARSRARDDDDDSGEVEGETGGRQAEDDLRGGVERRALASDEDPLGAARRRGGVRARGPGADSGAIV
jgi:hypothetical protein